MASLPRQTKAALIIVKHFLPGSSRCEAPGAFLAALAFLRVRVREKNAARHCPTVPEIQKCVDNQLFVFCPKMPDFARNAPDFARSLPEIFSFARKFSVLPDNILDSGKIIIT